MRFANGERRAAEKIATDHARGLVLLRASNVSELPVAEMIREDRILVGQWAVAIGRTFQPDQINTNVGIVSAKDRVLGKVLQTDAKVTVAKVGVKSPAKEAGIAVDDIITSVDGRPIRRFPDLQHALNRR